MPVHNLHQAIAPQICYWLCSHAGRPTSRKQGTGPGMPLTSAGVVCSRVEHCCRQVCAPHRLAGESLSRHVLCIRQRRAQPVKRFHPGKPPAIHTRLVWCCVCLPKDVWLQYAINCVVAATTCESATVTGRYCVQLTLHAPDLLRAMSGPNCFYSSNISTPRLNYDREPASPPHSRLTSSAAPCA